MAPRKGGNKKGGAAAEVAAPAAPEADNTTAVQASGTAGGRVPPPGSGASTPAPEPAASLSALASLEDRRKRLCTQLRDVERQIYDLETRYLEGCNPHANALKGYEALRSQLGSSKPAKAAPITPSDRIFSGSSMTAGTR